MASRYRDATAQEVRDWARAEGYDVGDRGRFSTEIVSEFNQAHRGEYVRYNGGTGQPAPAPTQARNSRSTQTSTRTQSRTGNSSPARRQPARTERAAPTTAPAQRQRRAPQREENVAAAVLVPSGTGLSEQQMEQFNRMLADANAVTGYENELTIIRIAPAQVA